MNSKFLTQLSYLFLATILSWAFSQSPQLSFYNLQLVAVLIIVILIKRKMIASRNKPDQQMFDAIILTTIVLLLVFSTGGANSPLFFLIYFLFLGLTFFFQPSVTLSLAFVLLVFLAPSVDSPNSIASLLSLFLIVPLSGILGKLYLQYLSSVKKIRFYKTNWSNDKKHLQKQETNTLLWLTTCLKPGLEEILDKTSQLLADLSHLTPSQKAHLKRIRRVAGHLLKGEEKLKQIVDKETD